MFPLNVAYQHDITNKIIIIILYLNCQVNSVCYFQLQVRRVLLSLQGRHQVSYNVAANIINCFMKRNLTFYLVFALKRDLKCHRDDDRFKVAGLHVLVECAVLGLMSVRDMIT